MWTTDDIDDLHASPPPGRQLAGYPVNIRPHLMADDLAPFVVAPRAPARRWLDDQPELIVPTKMGRDGKPQPDFARARPGLFASIFLAFPDRESALRSSLGRYWNDPTA